DLLEKSAVLVVGAFGRGVIGGAERWDFGVERTAFLLPFDAPPIQQPGVGESEQLKYPERVRRPPVVLVAVKHDRRIIIDSFSTKEFLELLRRHIVAEHRIIQIE